MLDLASGMKDRDRDVRVVVPATDATLKLAERGLERGIVVERTNALKADDHGGHQNVPKLIRFFLTHPSTITHLHTGDVCLPRSVTGVMRMLRLPPAIVTVHSPFTTMVATDSRAQYWARSIDVRRDTVISPSRHGREAQIRLGVNPARVQTIFNCVDGDKFGSGHAEPVLELLGLDRRTPLIVFSSRLDPQKRPLDAIEAFRLLCETDTSAHLAMIGNGVLEHEVREATRAAGLLDRVHLMGYCDDVPNWLAAATAWILPTAYENFSLAVLEAQAAGCAIVSTRCQGNEEILHDGVDAVVTEVGDVAAMANGLRKVLGDADFRSALQAGARRSSSQHTLRRMIDDYDSTYTAVLNGST